MTFDSDCFAQLIIDFEKNEKQNFYELDNWIISDDRDPYSGAFSLVLECVAGKAAKKITSLINIPTIGIGSSKFCDGQILVTDDLIGLSGFYPKFVKKYLNLRKILEKVIKKFKYDVNTGKFPKKINAY